MKQDLLTDKSLGEIVRMQRGELGISMRELGRRAGLNVTYISDIENDRRVPSESALTAIAGALEPKEGPMRERIFTLMMCAGGRMGATALESLKRRPALVRVLRALVKAEVNDKKLTELADILDSGKPKAWRP